MSEAGALDAAVRRLNPRVVQLVASLPGHAADDVIAFDLEWSEADGAMFEAGDGPGVQEAAPGAVLPAAGDAFWGQGAWLRRDGPRERDGQLWVRRGFLADRARSVEAVSQQRGPGWAALWQTLERHERTTLSFSLGAGALSLDRRRPLVMGIVNVTPDSFSDGGRFLDADAAVAHGEHLADAGAALLDVGGESTRPGSEFVSEAEELERVLPVIERLARRTDVPLSIDTRKSRVAAAALEAGARIVNDTSALADDPQMAPVVARAGAGLVLMHRQGVPRTMQAEPHYENCRAEVAAFLREAAARAQAAGISSGALMVDPGLGFGKRQQDNRDLLQHLGELRGLGFPVLLGASRKTFLGRMTGRDVGDREAATLAATAVAHREGAHVIRVHDVRASLDLLRVLASRDDG